MFIDASDYKVFYTVIKISVRVIESPSGPLMIAATGGLPV